MSNLKKELTETPYHGLKEKFEDLGIGETWKSGVKKNILISSALEILEKEEVIAETMEVSEAIEVVKQENIQAEIEKEDIVSSKFDKDVAKIQEDQDLWTAETMEKRISIYNNIFIQHRGTVKGAETLYKAEVLQKAYDLIYKS